MTSFTNEQKATEARRESHMRRRVYEKRVADGKMSPNDARRQIAIMEEIAAEYQARAHSERLL